MATGLASKLRAVAQRHRRKLVVGLLLVGLPIVAHVAVGWWTRIPLPEAPAVRFPVAEGPEPGVRRTLRGWRTHHGVHLVHLAGTPEEIGGQHTALLYDRMALDEQILHDGFAALVPFAPARMLMFDVGRVQYRGVLQGFPDARRRELAAEARAFDPDPYAGELPTFQRMVILHALYDIALGFERSPLLGCTAFGLGQTVTKDGHALFARAFDFEAAEVFDRDKVVFVVHEDGKIPFASVAWAGFVGVVTGMNAHGVAVAVHGGRAREPSTEGVPVAFSLREVLQNAKDTAEATRILAAQPVMVSHLVFVGDAAGRYAVVERAPGTPAHVRTTFPTAGRDRATVTNHFEGPLAGDPRDNQVRASTTTLARRARIDELVSPSQLPDGSATVETALGILRDHGCHGEACPLGDRRAIDAFIATHGVVADLTTHTLWVSSGPRLSGTFVRIDPALLEPLPAQGVAPIPNPAIETLPEDVALRDGRYDQGRLRAGGPLMKERR